MLPLSNIHTHSTFSDGKHSPEQMIEAALALGFHTLGFSDHGVAAYDDSAMPADAPDAYRCEILRLREKYAGRIHILLGIEHDFLSPYEDYPYDYFIESVHYVPVNGELFSVDYAPEVTRDAVDRLFGGDAYAMCRAYFATVCRSFEHTRADVLGHIELVTKFNEKHPMFDPADPRYLRYALETADLAAETGRLIEVNTGAIARGWRTAPYPDAPMLKHLAARGARILLSSDCHNAAYLDCAFRESAELARACGFKTAWQYRGKTIEEYML